MVHDSDLADRIDGLIDEFGKSTNPKERKLARFARKSRDADRLLSRTIDDMRESLDYLRVCIKYVVFDLEATRRENDHLRRTLAEEEERDYDDQF